jgi:hypothetical protein
LFLPQYFQSPLLQVTRLHAFAFPLAEVAVAVAAQHPEFAPLLVARLHQVSNLGLGFSVYASCMLLPVHG